MPNLNFLFYLYSICLIWSSIFVIVSSQPVYSLLFLVLSFVFSTFLLILLECEFLALLFIIVYVGAIAILFLFTIMMLESKMSNLSKNKIKYFPVGIIFGLFLLFFLYNQINNITFVDSSKHLIDIETGGNPKYSNAVADTIIDIADGFYINKYQNWYDLIDATNDVNVYGQVLYSYYIIQFLIVGLILLLVLIGIVYLTNSYENQTKQQSTFKQLSRKAKIFNTK